MAAGALLAVFVLPGPRAAVHHIRSAGRNRLLRAELSSTLAPSLGYTHTVP